MLVACSIKSLAVCSIIHNCFFVMKVLQSCMDIQITLELIPSVPVI